MSEARRHPKIISSIQIHPNGGPNLGKKKEFDREYNEYEFPTGNTHPVVEPSSESDEREQHDESYLHLKSIGHSKKPGYSAGSGLRSIAQGSADQASSAVNNQVKRFFFVWSIHFLAMIKLVSIS